ncbi:MAG TPA: M1 family aminopeptidase [Terriglobia bacterium]|nr:M1 family aminopeptidase [Terriglobia bacterium]
MRSCYSRTLAGLALAVSLFLAAPVRSTATETTNPDPRTLLTELNNVSIDSSHIYFLRDARITRDRASIYFNRGFLGFFNKVGGEVTGAAFFGDGEILLVPPDAVERQSLLWFTESPILDEKFSTAFLRFTDHTVAELLGKARPPDSEATEPPAELGSAWNEMAQRLNSGRSLRVLDDLTSDRRPEFFSAAIQGASLGTFELTVDGRRPEAVQLSAVREEDGVPYTDIWCSFKSADQGRETNAWTAPVHARSYRIETRIRPDRTLEGRADLDLEAQSPSRFLSFELSGSLEVTEVRDEHDSAVPAFQGALVSKPSERNNWVAVILPRAATPGERFHLRFTYHGGVIADAGNGVLYVGAHESWYPNLGPGLRSDYDLTFDYPDRLTLVATGRCLEDSPAQDHRHSHWIAADAPIAGFNLGPYDSRTRSLAKIQVKVYATPEAEMALQGKYLEAQAAAQMSTAEQPGTRGIAPRVAPPPIESLSPSALIGAVTDSASEAVTYFETLFGPFPYPQLAISQVPGSFGQGWPGLVYLPTLAFLPPAVLFQLGAKSGRAGIEERATLDHEIAHQWWGNLVGWRTYHDQWLSEGFASYAAALELRQEKDGNRLFRDLLADYRQDLMAKNKEGNTVESTGPIWLGGRLSNSLDPTGYEVIVYKKACWVIQMMRLLLTDPESGSDARFFQMLKDFVTAYGGRDPSTEDFLSHSERYMTRASDLDHDRKLDWFFKEWVYSTGLPEYRLKTSVRAVNGSYRVEGTITQHGVDPSFEMLVPVNVVYRSAVGRDSRASRVFVPVTNLGGRFHFTSAARPEHITIDEDAILTAR